MAASDPRRGSSSVPSAPRSCPRAGGRRCAAPTRNWIRASIRSRPRDRRRRSLGDDLPARQHRQPIGEVLRLVHEVRREEHGLAEFGEALDDVPRGMAGAGIEPGGRLVQEQQFGVTGERDRDVEAALLPAGELEYAGVAPSSLARPARSPRRRVAGSGSSRCRARSSRCTERYGSTPVDCSTMPIRSVEGLLVSRRVVTEHLRATGGRRAEAFEDLHGGGLARAVRSEQGEDLAPVDVQVDAFDRLDVPVGLVQALDFDHPIAHGVRLGSEGRGRQARRAAPSGSGRAVARALVDQVDQTARLAPTERRCR